MIKGVIFDLHGVIVTNGGDAVFEKHSLHRGFERDTIKKLLHAFFDASNLGEFNSLDDFFAKTKLSLPITINELNEVMEEHHLAKQIIPGMIELITSLKKNHKIALLTNYGANLDRIIKHTFNIYHLFDLIVNSHDIQIAKPDPKIFLHTLDKMRLNSNEVVFIDDLEKNVASARTLGIAGIVYQNTVQCKAELEQLLRPKKR